MASPDLFALGRSSLNPFLYADIGPPDGATTLTVASMFGRRGEDPWDEAARLARLPPAAAVASLAAMIVSAPDCCWTLAEATPMAERLVMLLPAPPSVADRLAGARRSPIERLLPRWQFGPLAAVALGLFVVVAVAFVWLTVADTWGSHGHGDRMRTVDPFARGSTR